MKNKSFWINLSLINLSIVAILGFCMRTKFLFPVPWIDYRNFLSAHSHFAFGGWMCLVLSTLLITELLPENLAAKKIYQWILWGVEISSVGMLLSFPFEGYGTVSIIFSTLFILITYLFGLVFIRDILVTPQVKPVRLFSISSLVSLILSSVGPFTLAYILMTKSTNSILYRDSIYAFLHFQYNGFFTLAVFALFFNFISRRGLEAGKPGKRFAVFLCLSILPSLFLSLLWHGNKIYFMIAALGSVLVLMALYYYNRFNMMLNKHVLFKSSMARILWLMAFLSFGLKMILNIGTIVPQLGHAVFGDRPVIIGFLHLVFLAFVTFFILSFLLEDGYFQRNGKNQRLPIYVFGFGVILSEVLLGLQGLQILFKTNNYLYSWLLWVSAIILMMGSIMIWMVRFRSDKR